MKQYKDYLQYIMDNGIDDGDRTGVGTRSVFDYTMKFDMNEGFPMVTTKKIYWKNILHELIWMYVKGDTNIRYLVRNKVNIWNEWPYESYVKLWNKGSIWFQGRFGMKAYGKPNRMLTLDEFKDRISSRLHFANRFGDLGPVYGKQALAYEGIKRPRPAKVELNQVEKVINQIKNEPLSRRIIMTLWNPTQIEAMKLPPCHGNHIQFYVRKGELSLKMLMRSNDAFIGAPYNISFYALFLLMVAHVTGLKAKELIITVNDAHIYANHFDQVKTLLERESFPLPTVTLNPAVTDFFKFKAEDITLNNYVSHDLIKAEIAV